VKITCLTTSLLPALRAAARAVSPRATMPILGTVLLRASEARLHITATDLEIGLETGCDAEIAEPGAIALPARLLAEIVASLPEG
jgi:DNA polymerase-3 subunit beta